MMMPGVPERGSHDYLRHDTSRLFAAFNIADGIVISELHRQHRAVEFRKFLVAIDKAVPAELDVHLATADPLNAIDKMCCHSWCDNVSLSRGGPR